MPPTQTKQYRDPINQAVRDARKALEASDVFRALKAAEAAQAARRIQTTAAKRCLKDVKDIKLSDEDVALLQKAATNHGYNEIGAAVASALISRVGDIIRERWAHWRRGPLEQATEFTPDERRAIMAALHPDNPSNERREEAFKLFAGKVKR